MRVILDEHDAAQLLRSMYNGRRNRVHVLICVCGAQADLRKSPAAWNGWQILPYPVCPRCIDNGPAPQVELFPSPSQARQRYVEQIRTMNGVSVSD